MPGHGGKGEFQTTQGEFPFELGLLMVELACLIPISTTNCTSVVSQDEAETGPELAEQLLIAFLRRSMSQCTLLCLSTKAVSLTGFWNEEGTRQCRHVFRGRSICNRRRGARVPPALPAHSPRNLPLAPPEQSVGIQRMHLF